jgi:hypothetical protein
MLYTPASLLVAVLETPLAEFVAVISAPATTAPEGSVIVPRIPPRSVCAKAEVMHTTLSTHPKKSLRAILHLSRVLSSAVTQITVDVKDNAANFAIHPYDPRIIIKSERNYVINERKLLHCDELRSQKNLRQCSCFGNFYAL